MSDDLDVVMVESSDGDATCKLAQFVKETEGLNMSMSVKRDD